MASVIADRVRETTTTTGTGSVTLGGAYTSFQTFSAAIGNANNTYYTIASATSGEWEVGIGTYSSSGNLLSRDTVLSSSNGGSLVSFTSGTKDVFVTQPASRAIFVQNAGTGLQTGTTAFTASRVLYANATSTTTTSSNLTFDGTTLVAANFTDSSLTSGRVTYAGAGGNLTDSANLTFDGTTLTANALTTTSTVTINGGTANGVAYLNGSKVLTTGSALTFDGTEFKVNAASGNVLIQPINVANAKLYLRHGSIGNNNGFEVDVNSNTIFLQAGTEQMRLTSTGLGIGTSSPGEKLEVKASSAMVKINSTASFAQLGYYNNGSLLWNAYADISSSEYRLGNSGGTQLTLTSSGNLGIGTSSPSQKLHVRQDQAAYTWGRFDNQSSSASAYAGIQVGAFGNTWGIAIGSSAANNNALTFVLDAGGSNSEKMRLDSSGNLGLGVTPSAWFSTYKVLQVNTNGSLSTNTDFFAVSNNAFVNSAGNDIYLTTGFAGRYRHVASSGAHQWFTAPSGTAGNAITFTQAMTLDASGNLGIGTSSPAEKLSVAGNITNTGVATFGTSGSNTYVSLNNNGYLRCDVANWFTLQAGSNGYQWRNNANNSTAQMTLDSSGNLGLGVAPSAWSGIAGGAFQNAGNGSIYSLGTDNVRFAQNVYFTNTGYTPRYVQTREATEYRLTGGQHQWLTAPSGTAGNAITFTQAMTLDASGNLGVGTTSPGVRLDVVSSSNAVGARIRARSGDDFGFLQFTNNAGSTEYAALSASSGTLAFYTGASSTERARITSGGDLLVGGQTSATTIGGRGSKINAQQAAATAEWAGAFIHPATTGTNAFGVGIRYSASAPNSAQNPFLYMEDNAAIRAEIRSNGGLANYSGNNVNLSDRREKTNFAPAKSYLDTICAIPVQTFNYIDQSEDDPGLTLGVVAQDVQAVAPELVMESNWGTEDTPKMRLSVYQTDLQYALMKALQELKSELDSVKAELATLKGA